MKLARYHDDTGRLWVGLVVEGDSLVPIAQPAGTGDEELLATAIGDRPAAPIGDPQPLSDITLLSPLARPASIRDFITFEQHYRAMLTQQGHEVPEEWYRTPVFYFSTTHQLLGDEDVVVPPETQELDFELEVAAVLGRDAANIGSEQAGDIIAGYTLFNDWSARDIQRSEMSLGLGPSKSKDFGNALGPFLVTTDELMGDPASPRMGLRARVNGKPYSEDRLEHMYHSFGELIAHAARDSRLRSGDVLGSGTAATGCIAELSKTHGEDTYPWLQTGDIVELEADEIGVLRNFVGHRR